MFTTMKHLVESMFPEHFWLTSNLEQWILFDLVPMDRYLDLTILSLVNRGLATIGQRDITQRVAYYY